MIKQSYGILPSAFGSPPPSFSSPTASAVASFPPLTWTVHRRLPFTRRLLSPCPPWVLFPKWKSDRSVVRPRCFCCKMNCWEVNNQMETMAYIMWNFPNLTIKLWHHGRWEDVKAFEAGVASWCLWSAEHWGHVVGVVGLCVTSVC